MGEMVPLDSRDSAMELQSRIEDQMNQIVEFEKQIRSMDSVCFLDRICTRAPSTGCFYRYWDDFQQIYSGNIVSGKMNAIRFLLLRKIDGYLIFIFRQNSHYYWNEDWKITMILSWVKRSGDDSRSQTTIPVSGWLHFQNFSKMKIYQKVHRQLSTIHLKMSFCYSVLAESDSTPRGSIVCLFLS